MSNVKPTENGDASCSGSDKINGEENKTGTETKSTNPQLSFNFPGNHTFFSRESY